MEMHLSNDLAILWKGFVMAKDELFVERREQGDYAVRRPNSERASLVASTQAGAIDAARKLEPEASILVERVRHTEGGKPDKWRKP
jgi:pyridoxine/pyridoxamine 5'-phosphate oxidase